MSYDQQSGRLALDADTLSYADLWAHTLDLAQTLPTDVTPGLYVLDCTPLRDQLSAHVIWKPTPEASGSTEPYVNFLDIYCPTPEEIEPVSFMQKVRAGMGQVRLTEGYDPKLADLNPHLSRDPALQTEVARQLLPATAHIKVHQPDLHTLDVYRRPTVNPDARFTPFHTLAKVALALVGFAGRPDEAYRQLVKKTAAPPPRQDAAELPLTWLTGRA